MKISRETLIIEANRSGFRAEVLEKVIRLVDLLNAFANDDFLKTRIALKGGTALNLFHFDLPRLSVDIDLNYIGSIERDIMLTEKPKILERIAKICDDKKYSSIRQPSEHAGGKWSLNYKSELVLNGRLELDLNFISRASLWPVNNLESIPVLDYYDLVGGKLTALFSRRKSRDLFDTYTIFTSTSDIDKSKIKLAFIVYAAASRTDIRKISLDHIDFDANELKNMLLPVLRQEKLKEAQDIHSWSNKLINSCKEHLDEIIRFSSNELEFLTNIIEHGEITPKFITEDETLINLISKHPVLLWKCANVKAFSKIKLVDDKSRD